MDGDRVGDVQGDRVHVAARRTQRRGGVLATLRVSGPDQDRHAQGGESLNRVSGRSHSRPGCLVSRVERVLESGDREVEEEPA
ncbi:hypothetical protein GCM10023191_021080 [Actinoallomurus oryzae]|uniref:Uncharacterized protein n=1 Tax=Actinoallomurus oryzae TaxID=502180 RepID=A0ABP8PPM4_9ACTN